MHIIAPGFLSVSFSLTWTVGTCGHYYWLSSSVMSIFKYQDYHSWRSVWARTVSLPASCQAAMAMLNDLQDAYRSEEFQRLVASWVSGHAHWCCPVGTFSAIYKKMGYQRCRTKKRTRPEKSCRLLPQLLRLLPSPFTILHKQVSSWAECALARFIQEICWEDGQKLRYLRLWLQRIFQHSFLLNTWWMDETSCDMPRPEKALVREWGNCINIRTPNNGQF